ncbi:conserved hypothetical protein [Perkinsus marinus ATCC 50983]|uniref:Amino acid transporter n=1 Tax=Perkinsus marinus (strain ATCC 50983 / TXsc) TaxID=423536 RepID=C5KLW7_PERM5|nr:conserved hypothetical protein [Perkinsus marinus ATCC 50983]EER14482.1 conserved hypothetical protein [Perkinsus marinus ATCC 50983]|eukprot:XP_002782687.1 conserved hypothetical protein [Perkinsus marinus ATCC 50983]
MSHSSPSRVNETYDAVVNKADAVSEPSSPTGSVATTAASSVVVGGGGYNAMEKGISLGSFFMTALNAMITIGLSVPFMFTTAGWLSIVFQIVAASAIFLCVLLVRACIDNPKIKKYGEEHHVPVFEREYAFLAGYCGGNTGRTAVTVVVSLEFFFTLAANIIAIGTCANMLVKEMSIEVWIIIFAALSLSFVLLPWFNEISRVMGIAGAFGAVLGAALWVASSIMILPETNIEANLIPKAPYPSNLITALGIAVFSSGAAPSLPPFYGVVKNATPRKIDLCILLAQIVSVLYVFMLGIAGMQICDGSCEQFYLVDLLSYPTSVIPSWFMYWIVIVQLVRIFAMSPVLLVPIMVSTEGMISSAMQRFSWGPSMLKHNAWRFTWRIIIVAAIAITSIGAQAEIAYIQAIAGTLLCSCDLFLFPLWFYLVIEQPKGSKRILAWIGVVLAVAFAIVGTVFSVMGMFV